MQYVWEPERIGDELNFDCFCLDIHLSVIINKLLLSYYYNYHRFIILLFQLIVCQCSCQSQGQGLVFKPRPRPGAEAKAKVVKSWSWHALRPRPEATSVKERSGIDPDFRERSLWVCSLDSALIFMIKKLRSQQFQSRDTYSSFTRWRHSLSVLN